MPDSWVAVLFLRLQGIYDYRWSSKFPNPEMQKIAMDEWALILGGISSEQIKLALDQCRKNSDEWPPNAKQFRNLCDRLIGWISEEEAKEMLYRRDLSHPIVKFCFDKIGSWDLSHDMANSLSKRVHSVYKIADNMFREGKLKNEDVSNESNAIKTKELAPRIKDNASVNTCAAVKNKSDAMSNFSALKSIDHNLINRMEVEPGSKLFDKDKFLSWKGWLMNLSEIEASQLSNQDKYARIRFLGEAEGIRRVEEVRRLASIGYSEPKEKIKKPVGVLPIKVYQKSWVD